MSTPQAWTTYLMRGALAVAAVAVVPKELDDRFGGRDDQVGLNVANGLGDIRKGLVVAVRHAHAATDKDVVTDYAVVLEDGQKAKVLSIDIDGIILRQGQAGFELAGQINLTIERFDLGEVLVGNNRFAVEPYLMVGPGAGGQVARDAVRQLLQRCIGRRPKRCRWGHHVAFHVTAGAESAQQTSIDAGDGLPQMRLDDAVKLNPLPRSDAQGAGRMFLGDGVEGQILRPVTFPPGILQRTIKL